MKMNLGVGDFKVKKYLKIKANAVPRCMRMFMVEFYRQCTIATPVDTGRARWGWNCSIRQIDKSVPPEGKYTIDVERAKKVFTVTAVTGKDTLYVSNSVHYIEKLNNGWSQQAPARFVQNSFMVAYNKLDTYIKVKGYSS